jgi:rhodanese-related sulfurtransferase
MVRQIRPAELSAWLNAVQTHGEPVVLDVREPAEWALASVQADGFALRTIPMGQIPNRLAELDPEQPVACLCHHGVRSMRVAAFLEAQGFAHVINIAGGIHAWSAELDPRIALY